MLIRWVLSFQITLNQLRLMALLLTRMFIGFTRSGLDQLIHNIWRSSVNKILILEVLAAIAVPIVAVAFGIMLSLAVL